MFHTLARRLFSVSAHAVPPVIPPVVHLPLTAWPPSTSKAVAPSYVTLPTHIFNAQPRPDILHQCVRAHLLGLRQGTAANKNRAQVKGSSRKIMRQKGSGRARVGSVRSPIRRGGGRAFAKQPKDWSIGLPRKVFEMGIRTALSERWRRSELCVIPDVPRPDTISTRLLLESFYTSPSTSAFSSSLFLLSEIPKEFHLSTRNLPGVQVRLIDDVDVYSLLQHKRIVIDVDSVQYLSDWLGRPQDALVGEELEDVPLPDPSVSMADVDALVSASTSPGAGELGEDKADGDGGVKEHDIVIEQEEAPVQEQRHDVDPLEEQTDRGDRIRDEMHTLGKQQSHTARAEDSPSLKDVL